MLSGGLAQSRFLGNRRRKEVTEKNEMDSVGHSGVHGHRVGSGVGADVPVDSGPAHLAGPYLLRYNVLGVSHGHHQIKVVI